MPRTVQDALHADPAVPTPAPRRRSPISTWAVALGLVALVAASVLYTFRPAGQFFFPRCSFHTLTGMLCPGCGGLRSVHELLHGRILMALQSNALFVAGVPIGVAWWALRKSKGQTASLHTRAVWWIFAGVVLFTVLRNLPGAPFTWLAPAP